MRATTNRSCSLPAARRGDLALEFLDPDEILPAAGEQARILWKCLVLDDHRGDPGAGIGADEVHDIDRVAIAGVEIGDNRDRHALDDCPGHVEMLGERQEARIGHPIASRQLEAARPDPVKAGELGEPRR